MSSTINVTRLVIIAAICMVVGDALGIVFGFGNAYARELVLWSFLWAFLILCVLPSVGATVYSVVRGRSGYFWCFVAMIASTAVTHVPLAVPLASFAVFYMVRGGLGLRQALAQVKAEAAPSERAPSGSHA
jgi:hypothetical protein